MNRAQRSTLIIVSLSHDLTKQKSYVGFVWADPGKRLGLEVPYGLPLDEVETAARTAIAAPSAELDSCDLAML